MINRIRFFFWKRKFGKMVDRIAKELLEKHSDIPKEVVLETLRQTLEDILRKTWTECTVELNYECKVILNLCK